MLIAVLSAKLHCSCKKILHGLPYHMGGNRQNRLRVCSPGGDKPEQSLGSNKRCLITSNFDANINSRSEAECTFDCHISAPIQ